MKKQQKKPKQILQQPKPKNILINNNVISDILTKEDVLKKYGDEFYKIYLILITYLNIPHSKAIEHLLNKENK